MNRLFKTLLLALLIPVCTYASGWNDEEYKRIEQSIQLPKLEATAKKYDISKFGAKVTNPAAQNQKAINRLIALVSKKGGGKVIVPKGTWNTGAIELKSHVELSLEEGATLHFVFDTRFSVRRLGMLLVWIKKEQIIELVLLMVLFINNL